MSTPCKNAPRVLVVEDEPSIRDSVVYALESEGFVVDWAGSGAAALSHVGETDYALIVLDVGLPDRSGFDVCRELRTTSQVPVIFLTARASEVDRVERQYLEATEEPMVDVADEALVQGEEFLLETALNNLVQNVKAQAWGFVSPGRPSSFRAASSC